MHTQDPFTHVVPVGHVTQTTPPVPQCWLLDVWQVLFWQQPFGQRVAVQRDTQLPFWHAVPAGQLTQVTPPVPHAWFCVPGWQVPFWQQPFGQLAGVQTHRPF